MRVQTSYILIIGTSAEKPHVNCQGFDRKRKRYYAGGTSSIDCTKDAISSLTEMFVGIVPSRPDRRRSMSSAETCLLETAWRRARQVPILPDLPADLKVGFFAGKEHEAWSDSLLTLCPR